MICDLFAEFHDSFYKKRKGWRDFLKFERHFVWIKDLILIYTEKFEAWYQQWLYEVKYKYFITEDHFHGKASHTKFLKLVECYQQESNLNQNIESESG